MRINIAVIYYSATGNVHRLAEAVAHGAAAAGAQVRLRTVAELAPPAAIAGNPRWAAHAAATRDVTEASLDDLQWADGFVFGSPTRFGNVAAQLRQFLDTTGAVIVPTGYTDPSIDAAGGNPYGVSSLDSETGPDDAALAAARYQGARVTLMAGALALRHTVGLSA